MRVVVTGDVLTEDVVHEFNEHDVVIDRRPESLTENELREAICDADGYIHGGSETVTERVIDAAGTLKAIIFWGAHPDAFFSRGALESIAEQGITLETTGTCGGAPEDAVRQSETAFELMIQVLSEQSTTA
ncbi:MAG TPA: hypothetical protein VGK02_06465 [Candidatus Aquicultor sp.]